MSEQTLDSRTRPLIIFIESPLERKKRRGFQRYSSRGPTAARSKRSAPATVGKSKFLVFFFSKFGASKTARAKLFRVWGLTARSNLKFAKYVANTFLQVLSRLQIQLFSIFMSFHEFQGHFFIEKE